MKKLLITSLSLVLITSAVADIQDPPGNLGPVDKLGRGVSNVMFGWTELFSTMIRDGDDSHTKSWGSGAVRGWNRMLARYGWGFYEISTYAVPIYKSSYRAPYTYKNTIMRPTKGFDEFSPEIGYQSARNYSRIQRY